MQSQIKQAIQHRGLYKATCSTESLEQAAVTQPHILTSELNTGLLHKLFIQDQSTPSSFYWLLKKTQKAFKGPYREQNYYFHGCIV